LLKLYPSIVKNGHYLIILIYLSVSPSN